MYIPFHSLPSTGKVWLYTADRYFTEADRATIDQLLVPFLDQWMAHGTALEASYTLVENRVLVIAVNEEAHAPTGCSIDAQVAIVQQLGQKLHIDFFNRLSLLIEDPNGELVERSLGAIKKELRAGALDPDYTRLLDNSITSLQEFKESWKKPLRHSWLGAFAPAQA